MRDPGAPISMFRKRGSGHVVGVTVDVADAVGDDDDDDDAELLADGLALDVAVPLALALGVGVALALALDVGVALADAVTLAELLALALEDALALAVALALTLELAVTLGEGDTEGDGVDEGDGAGEYTASRSTNDVYSSYSAALSDGRQPYGSVVYPSHNTPLPRSSDDRARRRTRTSSDAGTLTDACWRPVAPSASSLAVPSATPAPSRTGAHTESSSTTQE
jgi:hypothetical protein